MIILAMIPFLDRSTFDEIINTISNKDRKKVNNYLTTYIIHEEEKKDSIEKAKENKDNR